MHEAQVAYQAHTNSSKHHHGGTTMDVQKLDTGKHLAQELAHGSVIAVTWHKHSTPGFHYTAAGPHECDLDPALGVTCLVPTNEAPFTRPGYSEDAQFSEGVVRERVARTWPLGVDIGVELLTGTVKPILLLVGVPEGSISFTRFAFTLDPENPLHYYHNGNFGFRLQGQLMCHPALGTYFNHKTSALRTEPGNREDEVLIMTHQHLPLLAAGHVL